MPKRRKSITGQSEAFRHRIRQRLRREQETSLAREYRLSMMRAQVAFRRASETAVERQKRLSEMRVRQASRRAHETTVEREYRLSKAKEQSATRRASETEEEREYRLSKVRERAASRRASETEEEREYRLACARWISRRRHRLQKEIRQAQSAPSGVPEQTEYILPDVCVVPNLDAVKKEPIDFTEEIIPSVSQSIPIQTGSASSGVQDGIEIYLPHVPNLNIVKEEPIDDTGEILPTSQNIAAVQSSSSFTQSLKSEPIDNYVDDMTIPMKLDFIVPRAISTDIGESSSTSTFYTCEDSTEPPPKRPNLSLSPPTSNAELTDEFSVFGNFVAAKIRSFTNRHLQVEAQQRITNMFEMVMKKLNGDCLPVISEISSFQKSSPVTVTLTPSSNIIDNSRLQTQMPVTVTPRILNLKTPSLVTMLPSNAVIPFDIPITTTNTVALNMHVVRPCVSKF